MNIVIFCTHSYTSGFFAGIIISYLLVQITLWSTFHTLGLCWSIEFPFHYRRFKTEKKIKYIHIITLIIGLILPTIFALVPLIDGYTIALNPTDDCIAKNVAITFFITILPLNVLMAVNSTVLIILFWRIFKVCDTAHSVAVQDCITYSIIESSNIGICLKEE